MPPPPFFFSWNKYDGTSRGHDWSQKHQGAEGADRHTDRETDGGTEREVGGAQFLYVVWFQFGESHHPPVH